MTAEPYLKTPQDASFDAEITRIQAGQIGLSWIEADPHTVDRSFDIVRRYPADYVKLSFQIEGAAELQQGEQKIRLQPGQMSFYDASSPYRLSFPTRNTSIVVQVPKYTLSLPDALVKAGAATLLSPAPGMQELLRAQFRSLKRRHTELLFSGQAIASMLSASLAHRFPDFKVDSASDLIERIKTYALTHLSDPALTQLDAAHANFVSSRSLQRVFAQHGVSFAKWLREQRIRRAAQYLLTSEATIAQISVDCGFSTPQLFSKIFKEYFGCTASEWRQNNKDK